MLSGNGALELVKFWLLLATKYAHLCFMPSTLSFAKTFYPYSPLSKEMVKHEKRTI